MHVPPVNGSIGLAKGLTNLAGTYYDTQGVIQTTSVNAVNNYLQITITDTATLSADQLKCSDYAEDATAGDTEAAVEAAKWNTQVSIDSTKLNTDIGYENTIVNNEDNEQAIQSTNLTPVFAGDSYLALEFLSTSTLIATFQG